MGKTNERYELTDDGCTTVEYTGEDLRFTVPVLDRETGITWTVEAHYHGYSVSTWRQLAPIEVQRWVERSAEVRHEARAMLADEERWAEQEMAS